MSEMDIRQKVFEILSAVPDVGKVYDRERWTADWAKFLLLFQDPAPQRIVGWEITRPTVASVRLSNIERQDTHTYLIKGYMGLKDEDGTEKLFEALISSIQATFFPEITLGGTCSETSAVSKITGDTRMFGNVLCHYAELQFTATEYL